MLYKLDNKIYKEREIHFIYYLLKKRNQILNFVKLVAFVEYSILLIYEPINGEWVIRKTF